MSQDSQVGECREEHLLLTALGTNLTDSICYSPFPTPPPCFNEAPINRPRVRYIVRIALLLPESVTHVCTRS